MATITIQEAEANLSELIDKARAGEEVVITNDSRPVARLVAIPTAKRYKGKTRGDYALLKGKLHVGPEFFEPLSDDELETWGRKSVFASCGNTQGRWVFTGSVGLV